MQYLCVRSRWNFCSKMQYLAYGLGSGRAGGVSTLDQALQVAGFSRHFVAADSDNTMLTCSQATRPPRLNPVHAIALQSNAMQCNAMQCNATQFMDLGFLGGTRVGTLGEPGCGGTGNQGGRFPGERGPGSTRDNSPITLGSSRKPL